MTIRSIFLRNRISVYLAFGILLTSCGGGHDQFNILDPSTTGISFRNDIDETKVNLLDYYYCYNGSGLAAADFDQDGLIDLFFGGNLVSSALYINEGSMRFRDVSLQSLPHFNAWVHGATVCDINQDGWLDLYLCIGGPEKGSPPKNLLLVSQGLDGQGMISFEDQAEMYGLADTSFSVHAAFLDFDGDNDLDLFIGTNEVNTIEKTLIIPPQYSATEGRTIDKLYENVGDKFNRGVDFYELKDTSFGINQEGYCLGLTVDDINADGWPDIYVANDFMPNDLLYINQAGQGFKNSAPEFLPSQSLNGMGVAIADINQDLSPDIFVLDMLPDNSDRKKSMISQMESQPFFQKMDLGYNPEYIRNTLQLNLGTDPNTKGLVFTEIGQTLGIHATDWSWCPVFADFDGDGFKDLFISNGFVKDMTDLDYIKYDSYQASFGKTQEMRDETKRKLLSGLKEVKISNYLFRNQGDLQFEDITHESGVDYPSFSNSVIAEDLDNDGDIDLVTNDLNGPPLIYENRMAVKGKHLHLTVQYKKPNRLGIGAKIYWRDGAHQGYQYINPTSGYLSSSLGSVYISAPLTGSAVMEEIKIIWPDGCSDVYENVPCGDTFRIDYQTCQDAPQDVKTVQPLLQRSAILSSVSHAENVFNDFDFNPLWIRTYSSEGPAFGLGELDDQPELDAIMGGSKGNPPIALYQIGDNSRMDTLWDLESQFEDVDLAIFDYDLDGLNDVYVVSGGVEFDRDIELLQDRIYKNTGNGHFSKMEILPTMPTSGSVVRPCDYDRDGDIDLFVGGRIDKERYPHAPASYLLQNNIQSFAIVDTQATKHLGMITDAQWCDVDGDGWMDLVCLGEFMPLTILKNVDGKLTRISTPSLAAHLGLWESLVAGDIDGDGDMDFVAGNIGLNQDFTASPERPFMLFADDFDRNGRIDPVFAYYQKSVKDGSVELFPFHGMDDLVKGILSIRKRFYRYEIFSQSTLADVLGKEQLDTCLSWSATQFSSGVFLNNGTGFEFIPLPRLVQNAPIATIAMQDMNDDGIVDLLVGGNKNRFENTYGSQDNSPGWLLLGNGDGTFLPLLPAESGFAINGDLRAIEVMTGQDSSKLILGVGNDTGISAFRYH